MDYPATPAPFTTEYDEIDKEEFGLWPLSHMQAYADATCELRAQRAAPVGEPIYIEVHYDGWFAVKNLNQPFMFSFRFANKNTGVVSIGAGGAMLPGRTMRGEKQKNESFHTAALNLVNGVPNSSYVDWAHVPTKHDYVRTVNVPYKGVDFEFPKTKYNTKNNTNVFHELVGKNVLKCLELVDFEGHSIQVLKPGEYYTATPKGHDQDGFNYHWQGQVWVKDWVDGEPMPEWLLRYMAQRAAPVSEAVAQQGVQPVDKTSTGRKLVNLKILGTIYAEHVDGQALKLLESMVGSIEIIEGVACWDHIAMFDLRDEIEQLLDAAAQPVALEPLTLPEIERIYARYDGDMMNCTRSIERAIAAKLHGITPNSAKGGA